MKKAVVLLSGGVDSTTTLFYAKHRGFTTHALIFDYGQRHKKEIQQAKRIARLTRSEHKVIPIAFPWKGSSLLDKSQALPRHKTINIKKIPSTYVPGRNIIFLSFAVSLAETIGAYKVFIGANAVDYSGYPDCRPEFYTAYQKALEKGMKSGTQGRAIKIETPLIHKTKAQIIQFGFKLNVPYELTWSCYKGAGHPCRVCDSCRIRKKGFEAAGYEDPLK